MHTCKVAPFLMAGLLLSAQPWVIAKPKRDKSKVHLIPAFNKMNATTPLKEEPPDYLNSETLRTSPDGQYIALLTVGEGEYAYLTVYRHQKGDTTIVKKSIVSPQFELVGGCAWVPGHGHWLLVSNSNDGEYSAIRLWTGSKRVRTLRHTDAGGGYNVIGVNSDGRTAIYEHFGPGSPDPNYQRNVRLTMKLPRS